MSNYFSRVKNQLEQIIDWSDPNQFMILAAVVLMIGFLCLRGNTLRVSN